jgi:uncharacterized Tic20 family protein
MEPQPVTKNRAKNWALLLLLIPFIGLLWVPFYNSIDPLLFGIPFFFWYLLLWLPLSTAITAVVYFLYRSK